MQTFLTLMRRELATFFVSITGYLIIAAATFLISLGFVVMLVRLGNDPTNVPMTEMFYGTPFFWLILLLAFPVITMRLFALEKYSGTFETLMTTPVGDLQVVLAKFMAALVFYLIMWLPMLGCLYLVQQYSSGPGALDTGGMAGTYLGIFLIGAFFLSVGCFASAITRSQTVAAMVALALGMTLFLVAFLAGHATGSAAWMQEALSWFALFDQMNDFARGVVDTRAVVIHLSLTVFFLFLTLRAIESRRWR
jgi:ABC-2 type transport system permease protein